MMNKRHLPWLFVSIIASIALLLLPNASPAIAQTGWTEILDMRTPTGKSYINLANPAQRSLTTGLAQIHYESTVGSGVYDNEVDFSPRRVNNAQLDGWTVTQSGWHYALGQPGDKTTDGWVGFGGRQGDHWVKFRLARVGYLHWPTRTWDDLGGSPTYDRAQLTSVTSSSEYGHGNLVNVQTTATWSNIWTTPGGGSLNISWRANADGLKEDIIINQAAREWLAANRPPSTPATETWFGFALEVDWSDVPKIIRAGLELSPNDDFADDGQGIELRDALDRFLAFLPIGDVRVPSSDPLILDDVEPLRKRFWLDGDGNNYVLVGVRLPELAGMQAGDLVFDPSIEESVVAATDDGYCTSTGTYVSNSRVQVGEYPLDVFTMSAWIRFQTVALDNGVEISDARFNWTSWGTDWDGIGVKTDVFLNDIDDAVIPVDCTEFDAFARTTNFVAWDDQQTVVDTEYSSDDMSAVVGEVTSRPGWSSGSDLMVLWDDDGSTTDKMYQVWSYDLDAAKAPTLYVEYVLWTNSPPTITNKITSDSGQIDTPYSRQFDATDADSNQTLIWEINATDAAFLSIESLNRTTYINGTLPSSEGTYYVNVTVGDQATPTNATDWVNYTLSVVELVGEGTTFDRLLPVGLAISGFFLAFGFYAYSQKNSRTLGQLLVFFGGLVLIFVGFDYQLSIGDAEIALMIVAAGFSVVALSSVDMVQSYRR